MIPKTGIRFSDKTHVNKNPELDRASIKAHKNQALDLATGALLTGPMQANPGITNPGIDLKREETTHSRAYVVGPYPSDRIKNEPARALLAQRSPEASLAEAVGLAMAIELDIAGSQAIVLNSLRPATFIGSGKADEIAADVKRLDADLVVMDCALSPVQQRNLEKAFQVKVIDRTGLILEIFGKRARTKEGRLQVELAHLSYQKSRLVRSWTHLERQRGGFGFMGGPGETQIEADRRLIQDRIMRLERDLEKVKRTRGLHRKQREKVPFPVVALVGYTNAGKSTLFNRLTRAEVMAKDMLFATLDPTMRAIALPHGEKIMLSDTVGFISNLPTMLVSAFRATLEEVIEAEIILHVRDISDPDTEAQGADVADVLEEIGIGRDAGSKVIEVWNKADALDSETLAQLQQRAANRSSGRPSIVSALTGEGTGALLVQIENVLTQGRSAFHVTLPMADGAGLAWLHAHTEVLSRRQTDDTAFGLLVRVAPERIERFRRKFPEAEMKAAAE